MRYKKTKVYKFQAKFDFGTECAYRIMLFDSSASLATLGFAILSSFLATPGKKLWFLMGENSYSLEESLVPLSSLRLTRGRVINVIYDEDKVFCFDVRFMEAVEREELSYPVILDGKGLGIVDHLERPEMREALLRIRNLGIADTLFRSPDNGRWTPWDYDSYSLDEDNARLHQRIRCVEGVYSAHEE